MPGPDRVDRGAVYEKQWKSVAVGRLDLRKGKQAIIINMNAVDPSGQIALKALLLKKQINEDEAM